MPVQAVMQASGSHTVKCQILNPIMSRMAQPVSAVAWAVFIKISLGRSLFDYLGWLEWDFHTIRIILAVYFLFLITDA